MSALLYITIIGLWGFTWIAIKTHVGVVPIEISLIYRFAIAAAILFVVMIIKRERFRFSLRQHLFMMLLGSLLFSTNFFFFYSAAPYLTSGLMSIVMSTSVVMIMVNSKIFYKKQITPQMVLGGLLGLSGLACIFWAELKEFNLHDDACVGLMLALCGSYCFSWGNQISTKCTKLRIPLLPATTYGMFYGVVLANLYCLVNGIQYTWEPTMAYAASVFYLAIPGSVIGFMVYLKLVERLGPEKASYTTLFFPVVALIVSTYVEAFEWVMEDFVGIALVMAGNALVLAKPKPLLKPGSLTKKVTLN